MEEFEYRRSARDHCESARELLDGSKKSIRYACLELRMAIEALTYSSLKIYLSEVSNSAMKEWTPKRVLEELLVVNPTADQSITVTIGRQDENGVLAQEVLSLGEDRRFSIKWANRAHNALGSFLHEPTISQVERGIGDIEASARKKAIEILDELSAVLASSIWNVNFSQSCTFNCDCGFTVKRRLEIVEAGKPIVCASCGLSYDPELLGDEARFYRREFPYRCSGCGSEQAINERDLTKLPAVSCGACGFRSQVVQKFELKPLGSTSLK